MDDPTVPEAVELGSAPAPVWPSSVPAAEPTRCGAIVAVDTLGVPMGVEFLECPAAFRPNAARYLLGGRFSATGADSRLRVAMTFTWSPEPPAPFTQLAPGATVRATWPDAAINADDPGWPVGVPVTGYHYCGVRIDTNAGGAPTGVDAWSCDDAFRPEVVATAFELKFTGIGYSGILNARYSANVRYFAPDMAAAPSGPVSFAVTGVVTAPWLRFGLGIGPETRWGGAWVGFAIEEGYPSGGLGLALAPVRFGLFGPRVGVSGWTKARAPFEGATYTVLVEGGLRAGRTEGVFGEVMVGWGLRSREVEQDRFEEDGVQLGFRLGLVFAQRAL